MDRTMKPSKHKTGVRLFCLFIALLMIVSLFSTIVFSLSFAV